MATWKPLKIHEIIGNIESQTYVLPVIQRRLVWDEEKMALLFDTVLKGYSFGAIMAVKEEANTDALFATREFTKEGSIIPSREETGKLCRDRYLIIDGQQRLESFYIGLKGSINGHRLFFELDGDGGFQFGENGSALTDDGDSSTHLWVSVVDLYEKLKETRSPFDVGNFFCKRIDGELSDDVRRNIHANVAAFYEQFLCNDVVGFSYVELPSKDSKQNKKMIVELFRRLNDGGTRLSSFDLVASILKGVDCKMEAFLEGTVAKYSEMGVTQDNLIKLIFILEDQPLKDMEEVEDEDAKFAVREHARITAVLDAIKDFLQMASLDSYYKYHRPSFIPIYIIADYLFRLNEDNEKVRQHFSRGDTTSRDYVLIRNWIFNSFLNEVFKSKGSGWIPYKTGIRKLHKCIENNVGGNFPEQALYEVYMTHPLPKFSLEYTVERLPSLSMSFIFHLLYKECLSVRRNDVDHIMPRSILKDKGYDSAMINSICNFQLMDYSTNRGTKNGTPLSEWIETMGDKEKKNYIDTHAIPADKNLWNEDRFIDFYKERGNKLLAIIKAALAL